MIKFTFDLNYKDKMLTFNILLSKYMQRVRFVLPLKQHMIKKQKKKYEELKRMPVIPHQNSFMSKATQLNAEFGNVPGGHCL